MLLKLRDINQKKYQKLYYINIFEVKQHISTVGLPTVRYLGMSFFFDSTRLKVRNTSG